MYLSKRLLLDFDSRVKIAAQLQQANYQVANYSYLLLVHYQCIALKQSHQVVCYV